MKTTVSLYDWPLKNLPNLLDNEWQEETEVKKNYNWNSTYTKLFSEEEEAQLVSHVNPLNSVALVRERTIPIERPPPVGEVSANFYR